jgi:glutaredoxin
MAESKVVCYGASWCGDTFRSRRLMDEHGVPYEWCDIDEDPKHLEAVISYAGKRKIPVIVFEDGSVLIEPSDEELASKLGVAPQA